MNNEYFQLNLEKVDLSSLKTHVDFQNAARKLLPNATYEAGKAAALVAWDKFQVVVGRKFSTAEKTTFVESSAKSWAKGLNEVDMQEFTNTIISQLRAFVDINNT